ncbi:MAG: ABC transporter substrate-binding protein [Deltaproteobacteria bacterium]|nr:MAG: ABC transporter substrate-binding protein [Deltaproteobacteria bacterium]
MLLRPTRVGAGGGNLFHALFIGRACGGAGKSKRQLWRNFRLHGADVGRQRSAVVREIRPRSQSGLHLRRTAQHYVAHRRQRAIRQSLRHAALEAYQRGADTALIASPLNQLEHSLVVQNTIASAEQLRGKVLGMITAGSLTDILLREGLRLNGISEKDVTILPVGDLGARLSGLQTGRVHGVIIAGIQTLTASKMGFKTLIDYSKLPLEIAGSGILVRRSYVGKNPDITIRFLKAWIEGLYLFKAKPDFALNVLKKYVASQDIEVLTTIYGLYKEKLMNKPTPTARVAKSMLYLLSRSSPEVAGVNAEGFIEARFVNELESSGFFEEMNQKYGK